MRGFSRIAATRLTVLAMAALMLAVAMRSPAPAQQAPAALAVPQAEALLALIRSAMAALDHANKTGNYSVLREIGGPGMQASSSGQLSNVFAPLRSSGADLLAALIVTPQLTQPPVIGPQGHLHLTGHFPTRPQQIAFQIVYQPVSSQWRLFGLTVALQAVETATAAPAAGGPAPAQPQPAAKAKGTPADKPAKQEPQPGAKAK